MIKSLIIFLLAALLVMVMLLAGSVVRDTEQKHTIQSLRVENAGLRKEVETVRHALSLDSAVNDVDADKWLRENGLLRTDD